jgi:hypothetical protein
MKKWFRKPATIVSLNLGRKLVKGFPEESYFEPKSKR